MQKFPEGWCDLTRINYLQRKIIVSSILYYDFNESPISDKEYDEISKQLVELQSKYPDITESQYYYVFYDFDGSTGFDLRDRLNDKDKEYLVQFAMNVVNKRRAKKASK